MEIICFGQQNWDVCWTGKQQLMTRLAQRGHRVLYIDPQWDTGPLGLADRARALWPARSGVGLHESGVPGIHIFRGRYIHGLGPVNSYRWPFVLRGVIRRLGMRNVIGITLRPDLASWLDGARPRAKVYFAVDDMSAFPHIRDPLRERAEEDALIRRVDHAIAVSAPLYRRFRELNPRTTLLESGADLAHFSPARLARATPHAAVARLPHPRLGFVGQVDERIDQELLVEIADRHPDWHIVLAGRIKTGVDVSALERRPNVHLLGYQPYPELPGVLREFDVCLIPYRQNALTHACSPLKAFEYLATGLPVVSTPLDGLGSCRDGVVLGDSAATFERAIAAALAAPERGRERRLAIAAGNGWDARVDVLERVLAEALERGRRRGGRGRTALGGAPMSAQLSAVQRTAHAATTVVGRVHHGARMAVRLARHAGRATKGTGRAPIGIRRILVVRSRAHLGDVLAIVPLLSALRARYPAAHIALGAERRPPWLSLVPPGLVDDVHVLSGLSQPTRGARLRALMRTVAAGFDLVISGSRWFISPDAMLSGAPIRLGLDDGDSMQRLNTQRLTYDPTRHEVDNNLALLELLGIAVPPEDRAPRVHVDAPALARAHRQLAALGLPDGVKPIVLHAGAFKRTRQWPAERFAELARRLLEARTDAWIVLTGVDAEAPLAARIRDALPDGLQSRALVAAGRTDLTELVALLDRARLVIANDTGVMHLARARERPLLALMGAEDHRRWGPYPIGRSPVTVMRHVVPCAPCARMDCPTLHCLRLLAVDAVEAEALRLLDLPADRPDYRLRLERHSWEDLHSRGLPLPVARVTVPTDQSPERAARLIATQDYPLIEIGPPGRDPDPDGLPGHVAIPLATNGAWNWSQHIGDRVARAIREGT